MAEPGLKPCEPGLEDSGKSAILSRLDKIMIDLVIARHKVGLEFRVTYLDGSYNSTLSENLSTETSPLSNKGIINI